MPELFGVDIAGIVAQELGGGLLPCTLRTYTLGDRTLGALTHGQAKTTKTTVAARGVISDYATRDMGEGSIIKVGDRRILLIGNSLADSTGTLLVPDNGSEIDIEGSTYVVCHVTRDPAAATYDCQVRRA